MQKIFKNIGWTVLETIGFALTFALLLSLEWESISLISHHRIFPWEYADLNESTNPYPLMLLSFLPILLSAIAASWILHRFIFKRQLIDLGFRMDQVEKLFGKGLFMSLLMILPGFILLTLGSQIKLLAPTWSLLYFIGFILFFFIQSAGEEVLTRAYLIPTIEHRLGTLIAVVISGSFFAFLHIWNDHFTWIGFINILFGGFIMAILFAAYRNIWICIGYHAGWNFIQGSLFDFNVSGLDVYSFIQFIPVGYPRITGADFGYEGSLVAILFQGGLLYYLLRNHWSILFNKKPESIPAMITDQLPLHSPELPTENQHDYAKDL